MRAASLLLASLALLAPRIAWAGGGGEQGSHTVISNIALCVVAASAVGLVVRWLKQPLILGYMLAGALIGPLGLGLIEDQSEISTIAEIGLILLLFMIGLEINLREMLAAGRLVLLTGALQFPLAVGIGVAALTGAAALGVSLGGGSHAVLYGAVALGASSTMIVVKLLHDKHELDTLAGRVTIGVLVLQDVWAILVLVVQPSLSDPRLSGLLQTFVAGALLVAAALLASRHVLPKVFHSVAKTPELLLVVSLGWCFLVALVASHESVGLSMEMGALIAGVSLATFPYNLDVIAKVTHIRDFFTTLFFVALAMQIPAPEPAVLAGAAVLCAALVLTRVAGVFGVLLAAGAGPRIATLSTVNLAQMSEFSLVILALGVSFGHIGQQTLTAVIWAFAVLAVCSPYLVKGSDRIASAVTRLLGREAARPSPAEHAREKRRRPVVLLGFFRNASALLADLRRDHEYVLDDILVVDFNPVTKKSLEEAGVACVYGDISHVDTLHHAGLKDAEVVLCTIPDSVLKGTTNAKLLSVVRDVAPQARVVVTAETADQARALYAAGADFVLQPALANAHVAVQALEQALRGSLEGMREDALLQLEDRREVLS